MTEQVTNEELEDGLADLLVAARKGLRCLHIAVDEEVARDVENRVEAVFSVIERKPKTTEEPEQK